MANKSSSPLLIYDEDNSMEIFSTSDNDFEEKDNEINQNPYLMRWLESKPKYGKFQFRGYVEYFKNAKASKCLIKSCDRLLSCNNAGNIKRHYRRIHNFIILHGKINPFPEGEADSSNLDKYFSYDSIANKSFCKVPGCNKVLEGKDPKNMHHFRLDHSYKTNHKDWINLCRLRYVRSKLPLNELITYDKQTSSYRCLFLNCEYTLEKNFFAAEKHYHDVHEIVFSKYTGNARSSYLFNNEETSDQQSAESIELDNFQDESLCDDQDSANESNGKETTKPLKVNNNKRKFFASNYVEYCKITNISKCLIQNCGRLLKGLSPFNIQRHYQLLHNMNVLCFLKDFTALEAPDYGLKSQLTNFVSYNEGAAAYQCLFMNCDDNLQNDMNIIKSHYYEKHEIILSKKISKTSRAYKGQYSEDENEPNCSRSLIKAAKSSRDIVTNYVDLNSRCLMKSCPMQNEPLVDEVTIERHYRKVHNIHIGLNLSLADDELLSNYGEQECLKINDFVFFDQEVPICRCLFTKCNEILDNCLHSIKKHYREKHMAVIGKSFESSYSKINQHHRCESASSENDSLFVKNEVLSDDEEPLHLSKKRCHIPGLSTIENENSNEIGDFSTTRINNETRDDYGARTTNRYYLKDITLTKQKFLESCFGLVIQRDLYLNLFDDDVFFKHLLSPYEKIINFHIDSKLLLDIMLRANDIIEDVLRANFSNKILGLELYVVAREKKYFITINVRFIHEQTIRNHLIGFMPINKAGAEILPISEYLMKFNIDKQQVYMTTILADLVLSEEEKIIEILNNICHHNPNIKLHPIHYIIMLYKSSVQKYSEDIKNWLKLLNNNDYKINEDVFNQLNELQRQMENSTEVDIKPESIAAPNLFLKALKTFSNFMNKFHEEQYVAGDLYRDLLCCELELKGEQMKNNNTYAGKLCEDLMECKNNLMQSDGFMAALYLDSRFNFWGSRLLTDDQKIIGKHFLCSLWDSHSKHLRFANDQIDPSENNDDHKMNSIDDEYDLLNQHIKDITPLKPNIIDDLITNAVSTKREPFSVDILKYWHSKRHDMADVINLTKIAFIFPSSQHMLLYLKANFSISHNDSDKIDKFLIRHNKNILDENLDLVFQRFS